jgi:hypothetical protein
VANTQLLITSVHKLYTASHSFSSPAVHKNCTSHSCLVASVKQYTCNHLQNSCSFTASFVPTCNLSCTWKDAHMTPLTHRCNQQLPRCKLLLKQSPCSPALHQLLCRSTVSKYWSYGLPLVHGCTSTDAHCCHTCASTSKYTAISITLSTALRHHTASTFRIF